MGGGGLMGALSSMMGGHYPSGGITLGPAMTFGFIAAWAGCYRGAVAKRSALGVGEAATSAAVLGITLIVVSDALFAVIFNLFNL